jgi:hypothetical protein
MPFMNFLAYGIGTCTVLLENAENPWTWEAYLPYLKTDFGRQPRKEVELLRSHRVSLMRVEDAIMFKSQWSARW